MSSHAILNNIKFVTGNINKVREAGEILGISLQQVDIPDLYELQTHDPEAIVRHKLSQAYAVVKGPVLVEDSGLIFSAWNGLPGALVKWFETTVGCEGMLKMLEPFDNKEATAICYVGLHDGNNMTIAKGEVRGRVAPQLHGSSGFGWDVLFIPEGHERTYAEMPATEKNAISHRKMAFETLKEMIA